MSVSVYSGAAADQLRGVPEGSARLPRRLAPPARPRLPQPLLGRRLQFPGGHPLLHCLYPAVHGLGQGLFRGAQITTAPGGVQLDTVPGRPYGLQTIFSVLSGHTCPLQMCKHHHHQALVV